MKWMRTAAAISAATVLAVLTATAATPPAHPYIVHVKPLPESKILHRVMPQYSPDAADAHIQGVVRIEVMIGKDGRTERIHAIGGHPLLVPAAMQAVRQWTYQPTQVDGTPVRVVTEIDLAFNLDARGLPVPPRVIQSGLVPAAGR